MSRQTHRNAWAWAKAEEEAFKGACALESCERPAAGVIDTLGGIKGICAEDAPRAEMRGYTVRKTPAYVWPGSDRYESLQTGTDGSNRP